MTKPIAYLIIFVLFSASAFAQSVPNIVIILTDDQGYADVSFNPDHYKEISTPNIDSLAKEGVIFTQAYTSGSVCSPTRAGLMLGRYQQRVGVYTAYEGGAGFDPTIPIFPSFLPSIYHSSVIGKWHLGLDKDAPALKWHALNRGFDECYYFMGRGGHDYFSLKSANGNHFAPIYRNKTTLTETEYEGYLTTRFTEEAVNFIEREKSNPFFLYLAYSAVHAPAQAPQDDIDKYRQMFPELTEKRIISLAMLHHLDLGVGAVVKKLKDEKLWDNTLLIFLTDNGGSLDMEANNGKLRGFKESLYEGGIRTPFIISWPNEFEGGKTIETPIISLDILPTVLSAVGAKYDADSLDGKNIIPLICEGELTHHDELYWDMGGKSEYWAIRRGNMKAISINGKIEIYNLFNDPSESIDRSRGQYSRVLKFKERHQQWLVEMKKSESTLNYKPSIPFKRDDTED